MDKKNIDIYKEKMKELKINQIDLSNLSNIPLNTIRNIFSQRTKNPRTDTIQAIEKTLKIKEINSFKIVQNYYTPEEEEIIKAYRHLNERDKNMILTLIKTALPKEELQNYNYITNIKE